MNNLKIFLSSAVFSFRAQFEWLNPPMWLTMKFVLSLSQMAFFVFVGMFSTASSASDASSIITFIAIGNALQSLSWNTVFSITNITGQDKWNGTLPLVLATPVSRLPLFIGRAMMHVLDGILSVAISFMFAAFLFGVNFGNANALALTITVVLTAFTMAGYGLLIGGFAFHIRDPMIFANIFTFILLIFCGVNFHVEALPPAIQPVSYAFPLTYGIMAARRAIEGAQLADISITLAQQLAVGLVSMMLGYFFFKTFERKARKSGRMEAI